MNRPEDEPTNREMEEILHCFNDAVESQDIPAAAFAALEILNRVRDHYGKNPGRHLELY